MQKRPVAMAFLAATFLCSTASSAASFTSVALPTLNTDLTAWTDGAAYAGLFPSAQTLAGIPFQLQSSGGANAYEVAAGNTTLDIATSVFGATDVYTLINTAWGSPGATVGSLTFRGSAGASYTVDLVEGLNVRDHYFNPNAFENSTSAPYVTQAVWGVNASGNAHLDMQDFALPATFQSQSLIDIRFAGVGAGFPQGQPFIAGLTVGAVPEPASLSILLVGLGVLGTCEVRRRRSRLVRI